jgi:Phage integrase, N-terminal SAM-like domain
MESAKVYPLNGSRLELRALAPTQPRPKLLDQVRQAVRTRHYSPKTEESYVHWIKRFIFFHNKRHPAEMGEKEIGQFLSGLATDRQVSASTQNQALNAILFLYRDVLRKEIGLRRRRGSCEKTAQASGGFNTPRSEIYSRCPRSFRLADGDASLRSGPATDGVFAAESQRYRFHHQSNSCACRQRRQRSAHDASGSRERTTRQASGNNQGATAARSRTRLGASRIAERLGAQIPQRGKRVGMAMGISRNEPLHR